ncbi:hypothetical protein TPHA_0G02420 [Tetrapisispora phaffii CBS 4417]|uniref:Aldehyde dehydrogenase n=1 Tax=Tetrapisispora phaffii (strain ATCC 24235 / CBS 4417 / NBRC 1672 / NRRL Y-8282 / UCD 70-5) TaxID=1071381 RepID=G8BVZ9_TETPH|nr:hypothetical protein TPHA_0G02420 [Tetrapisispora phaffii CBS 4417]CCE64077.1 hypothetical protein TPHA_0G02420 [Tetrapisispora phaffii CBS 4417]
MTSVPLVYDSLDEIDDKVQLVNDFYHDHRLEYSQKKNIRKEELNFRLLQLKKLYYSVMDNEEMLIEAMYKDFHRAKMESLSFELIKLQNDILFLIKNLKKWYLKPTKLKDYTPPFMFGNIFVDNISLGSVLVISPFNFPVLLALAPLAGAISGGNTVILKPSEVTSYSAMALQKVIEDSKFPKGMIEIVQGGIKETTRLLESGKFNKIFYTGSEKVGSIVAVAASKTVTPCILELGGKSPTFITEHFSKSNIKTAIKRTFFSGFANAGQICVRPDYLVVHESIYDEVVSISKDVLNEFWPSLTEDTEYTYLVNETSFKNAKKVLNMTKGEIYSVDCKEKEELENNLCIPPTIIFNIDWSDSVMESENFSPIIPIIKYTNLDNAIDNIIKCHDTPLVQYIFSNDRQETEHILNRVRSGGCIVGDTLIHLGIADAPFGGIGKSGYGNYGGKWSFKAFTHERLSFKQPFWMDLLLSMRYPPYTKSKTNLVQFATANKPWFDREGNDLFPWTRLSYILAIIFIFISILVGYCYA